MNFLLKLDKKDRDNVLFIDLGDVENVLGPAFSEPLAQGHIDNMSHSFLTEEELERLLNKGQKAKEVISKLESEENTKYYQEEVVPVLLEEIKEMYDLTDEETDFLKEEFGDTLFRDFAPCGVFEDTKELGTEKAYQNGYIDFNSLETTLDCPKRFMDRDMNLKPEEFGEYILDSENYMKLCSGRILCTFR